MNEDVSEAVRELMLKAAIISAKGDEKATKLLRVTMLKQLIAANTAIQSAIVALVDLEDLDNLKGKADDTTATPDAQAMQLFSAAVTSLSDEGWTIDGDGDGLYPYNGRRLRVAYRTGSSVCSEANYQTPWLHAIDLGGLNSVPAPSRLHDEQALPAEPSLADIATELRVFAGRMSLA